MSKKQIADITLNDLSALGGIETGSRYRLPYFANQGYEVYSITRYPSRIDYLPKATGLHYIFIPKWLSRLPTYAVVLIPIMAHVFCIVAYLRGVKKVRVFHAHDVYSATACCAAKILPGVKVAITLHGSASYQIQHFGGDIRSNIRLKAKIFAFLVHLLERFAYLVADKLMAVSEFEQRFINKIVPKRNVIILRNGVDIAKFKPRKQTLPEIPSNKKIILFVGRLVEKNGPYLILQSVPYVVRKYEECHFVFVGGGRLRPRCDSFVVQNKLEEYVSFLGGRWDVDRIMNCADIFVSHVASLVDGVGNNVLEALASGLPCVVGEDEITLRLFSNGVNALLVKKDSPSDIADGILRLLSDPELPAQLSRNARTIAVDNFSIEAQFGKMEAILKGLAERK